MCTKLSVEYFRHFFFSRNNEVHKFCKTTSVVSINRDPCSRAFYYTELFRIFLFYLLDRFKAFDLNIKRSIENFRQGGIIDIKTEDTEEM